MNKRANRMKDTKKGSMNDKILLYAGIGIVVFALIVLSLVLYSKSLSDDVKNSTMSLEEIARMTENTTNNTANNTQSASTEFGKTVEEAEKELEKNATNQTNTSANNTNQNAATTNKANTPTTNKANTSNVATNSEVKKEEPKKELEFAKPVDGEIMREYAKDNLIYSETLKEWTTHLGIDIKAEKTTVVKSAEAGTVKSIKNDPRFGLTIVVEHADGFQTVYSNLLTSEFVVEGEKVEKGQSLGTVGNTAIFEIADEPHLHFEILKDAVQVDPSIYIK